MSFQTRKILSLQMEPMIVMDSSPLKQWGPRLTALFDKLTWSLWSDMAMECSRTKGQVIQERHGPLSEKSISNIGAAELGL